MFTSLKTNMIQQEERLRRWGGVYWVTIKETGKRTEESSFEEQQQKRQKAFQFNFGKQYMKYNLGYNALSHWETLQQDVPTLNNYSSHPSKHSLRVQVDDIKASDLGSNFDGLEARQQRETIEKDKKSQIPLVSKYNQDRRWSVISFGTHPRLVSEIRVPFRFAQYYIYIYLLYTCFVISIVALPARPKTHYRSSWPASLLNPESCVLWPVSWRKTTVRILLERTLSYMRWYIYIYLIYFPWSA